MFKNKQWKKQFEVKHKGKMFMTEIKNGAKKVFEELNKHEQRLLRKEFGKCVGTRYKVFFWCGVAMLALTLVCAGFSLYYMFGILAFGKVSYRLYIFAALVTVCSCGAMLVSSPYHKKFRKWLKDDKNIVMRADVNNSRYER